MFFQLIKNMGLRYTFYRVFHEIEKSLGILKRKHPMNTIAKQFVTLEEWRKSNIPFVILERESLEFDKIQSATLKEKALKILNGEVLFFSSDWKIIKGNDSWITNPETKFKYDVSKHWSEINDFDIKNGDIKYVWEKSRFSYLLTLMRYDYHFNEDHSAFVFDEIESWIDSNPINQGPNWKCSQEIGLRICNWVYILNFYKNAEALNEQRWNKIQNVIYWSLHHIYHHINFSRIAVRNNHAITETLMLTLSELLFPFIPETKVWSKKGRKWFEKEIAYQIYDDGTFLQFSMNYHRVVIQLLSLGISLTEINEKPFTSVVYEKAKKSLDFLYQCMQEKSGYLPNYGSNDGALFFPFAESDYRDFRPQLNTLHTILYKTNLVDDPNSNEDVNWVVPHSIKNTHIENRIIKKEGIINYPIGGYYLLREKEIFTFIRCGNHKDRPAHADNLHLDIWYKGTNVLRDSGTYKYNTNHEWQHYFTGTMAHNTVTVENNAQMLKGSRFIWYFWTQCNRAGWEETTEEYIFKGEISAFRFLHPKSTHARTIIKSKESTEWFIEDKVKHLSTFEKNQNWHYATAFPITFSAFSDGHKVASVPIASYYSLYYGAKENGDGLSFSFKDKIETKIKIE